MPAHALLVIDSSTMREPVGSSAPRVSEPRQALVIPISVETFSNSFTYDIAQISNELSAPGTPFPVPFWDATTRTQAVTVPLIPLHVPHPTSIPLLLLFGLGLHRSISQATSDGAHPGRSPKLTRFDHATVATKGLLAPYLLPIPVIEEFPAGAAMAETMARLCTDDELQRAFAHNQGLWRNVLLLGPRDGALVDMVGTAWNVTKEAKRMRERYRRGDFFGGVGPASASASGLPI